MALKKTSGIFRAKIFFAVGLAVASCSSPSFKGAGGNAVNGATGVSTNPGEGTSENGSDSTVGSTTTDANNGKENPTTSTNGNGDSSTANTGNINKSSNLNCSVNGKVILHGQTVELYSAAVSSNCASIKQFRTCTNGVVSGSNNYLFSGCSAPKKFDAVNCSKNGGHWLEKDYIGWKTGACWLVGYNGQSCSQVCGGKAFVNMAATGFAGSKGNTDENPTNSQAPGDYSKGATQLCRDALQISVPDWQGSTNYCESQQGVGCAQLANGPNGQIVYARYWAVETTADAVSREARRACACQD